MPIQVDVNVMHTIVFPTAPPTWLVATLNAVLAPYFARLQNDMSAANDRVTALLTAANASTDAAVARVAATVTDLNTQIATLTAELAAGGLTADEEAAVEAGITALQAKVDAIDPAIPAPAPGP